MCHTHPDDSKILNQALILAHPWYFCIWMEVSHLLSNGDDKRVGISFQPDLNFYLSGSDGDDMVNVRQQQI
ncbi:hypothetical protein DK846_16510 [Methanospirillum lacunae]|uniref:Uncharacterized protein n=1 Tax=Methanospirillum lacunae TaxID=668570 RepID=A0A2V2N1M4_9EURY|nr:hypothetical protein DK846_16510 [Methanospirillum lacunae]